MWKISHRPPQYINDIILSKAKQILISNQATLDDILHGQYIYEEWKMITNKDLVFEIIQIHKSPWDRPFPTVILILDKQPNIPIHNR